MRGLGLAKRKCLYPGSDLRLFTAWASVDPSKLSDADQAQNLVNGKWILSKNTKTIVDPWNGKPMLKIPDPQESELGPFVESLRKVPKSGLHNPYKNPERYVLYGEISRKAAVELRKPETADFFAKLIQKVAPKHYKQAIGEVTVLTKFLDNFSGDTIRMMARGFTQSGDHTGQTSSGVRWPFGAVSIITPFNFPLEIPSIQLLSALYMGNKPLVHVDHRVSIVNEQFLRLLHHCGMPKEDCDYFHGNGLMMNKILTDASPRSTLFTGSQRVAEKLAKDLNGKVFLEDAGFDWKILGPDVSDVDYVAWQCDQDAYACSGQKCSAQSLLFMHKNWSNAGLVNKLAALASKRNTNDQSIGPILSWSTENLLKHAEALKKIPGAKVLFGAEKIEGFQTPSQYGLIRPTAIFVPLEEILKPENFSLVTKEVFAPFQVVTEYDTKDLDKVLEVTERLSHHLTAAVVSNDAQFVNKVVANTVNGTFYCGIRGRTTGAPQNHWFGPAGDPRGAGIHTPEAIRLVWSCHREIVTDVGPAPSDISSLQTT